MLTVPFWRSPLSHELVGLVVSRVNFSQKIIYVKNYNRTSLELDYVSRVKTIFACLCGTKHLSNA
jgi:hypothetical protein